MGNVTVLVKLTNEQDAALGRRGHISREDVRSCEVEAVVDTDEVLMCLPEDLVEQLGLSPCPAQTMRSANGRPRKVRRATTLQIQIGDRLAHQDCAVLPRGAQARVGRLVLHMMDLVVDEERECLAPGHPDADGPVYDLLSHAA